MSFRNVILPPCLAIKEHANKPKQSNAHGLTSNREYGGKLESSARISHPEQH